jgi:hypothetical protein
MSNQGYDLLAAAGFFAACTLVAIFRLRKEHSNEIYLIWYTISFFFTLFLGLEIIASGSDAAGVCGSYESACRTVYGYLTDFVGESKLLVIFLTLAIVPQFFAYFLSGLSGSASAPKFVSEVTKLALWSFIKFSAAFAGILLAKPVAKLYLGVPVTIGDFGIAIFFISSAFGFALYALIIIERLPTFVRNELFPTGSFLFRVVAKIHWFFTRNVHDEKN